MKISYNWLQTYFKDPLPTPEKLAELFTFRFAEVESVEAFQDDTVLDVKVLPDRAHYALCHKGIATEIAAITKLSMHLPEASFAVTSTKKVAVVIENQTLCRRYTARYIENVTVGISPSGFVEALAAIGQRSINNIVDAANFAMFDIGQPLHAFDADKITGSITVRMAKAGETITTLDGKDVVLSPEILIIADDAGPLALAGIKGGKRAEVDAQTKNIIIEAAHFDPAYIRKASAMLGIRTDSSKRYENEITPEWAALGSERVSALIALMIPGVLVGELADAYPVKAESRHMAFDPRYASQLLGTEISEKIAADILTSFGIGVAVGENGLDLTLPPERLDLILPEDVVEEIGRIYGYENIAAVPPPKLAEQIVPPKSMYYEEKIRDTLVALGFSEVFTYSFRSQGAVEIEKSMASDKNFLRENLISNIEEALVRNAHNSDLLGLDDVKIFEIGKVFDPASEKRSLALGVRKIKKEKGVTDESILQAAFEACEKILGSSTPSVVKKSEAGAVTEILLDSFFAALPNPTSWDLAPYAQANTIYRKISAYPFMLRDIAVFVPIETSQDEISALIVSQAGELLVRVRLFDIFTKTFEDGSQKTSYAFRLVFQSYEKTLSDDEANVIMERITAAVSARGWEVR